MSSENPNAPRLEAQILFILAQAGVDATKADACLAWAFGPDAWTIPPREWPARWNKLHPGAFHADRKDKFVEFVYVVGFYFTQQQAKAQLGLGRK